MSETDLFPAKARSLVEFTAAKEGELSVTDQLLTSEGKLEHNKGAGHVDFMFQYLGYWFAVNAEQRGTKAVLQIHGIIGHLPYSFHSSFARKNVWHVVRTASKQINAKVRLDEKQRILLVDTIIKEGTLTPKLMMAETAKVLLRLKPYLELVTQLQPPKWSQMEHTVQVER